MRAFLGREGHVHVERQSRALEPLAVVVGLRAADGVGERAGDAFKLAGEVVGVVDPALGGAAHQAHALHPHDGLSQALRPFPCVGIDQDAGKARCVCVGCHALVGEGGGENLRQLGHTQALGHDVGGALACEHLVGLCLNVGAQLVGHAEAGLVERGADAVNVGDECGGVVLGVDGEELDVVHDLLRVNLGVYKQGKKRQVGGGVCGAGAVAQVEHKLAGALLGEGCRSLRNGLGDLAGLGEVVDSHDDGVVLHAGRELGIGCLHGVATQVEAHDVAVAGEDVDVVEHAHSQVPVLAVRASTPDDVGSHVLEQEVDPVHAHGDDAHARSQARLLPRFGHIEEVLMTLDAKAQVILLITAVVAGDLAGFGTCGGEVLARGKQELVHVGVGVARRLGQRVAAGLGVADGAPAGRGVHVQRLADGVVARQVKETSHCQSFHDDSLSLAGHLIGLNSGMFAS